MLVSSGQSSSGAGSPRERRCRRRLSPLVPPGSRRGCARASAPSRAARGCNRLSGQLKSASAVGHLDDLAGAHHRDAVAHLADHREIVADEQQRQAGRVAQILQQVQDLRLDRDIERGGRLVADDQARPRRRAPAQSRAAGAARPRRRAESAAPLRRGQAPPPRSAAPTSAAASARRGRELVEQDRLGQDAPDPHARVERRIGILEDHLDGAPCLAATGRGVDAGDHLAIEADRAAGRLAQPRDDVGDGGLAATASRRRGRRPLPAGSRS